MTDPRGGAEFVMPAEDEKLKAERIRDMMEAIKIAALGHAAALYEENRDRILEAAKLPDGTPFRVLRQVKPGCGKCRGSGVRFTIEHHPRSQKEPEMMSFGPGGFKFPPRDREPVGMIRECFCVSYELIVLPTPEPTETERAR